MSIENQDSDPNIRPHNIAAYASILFLSAIGVWRADTLLQSDAITTYAQTLPDQPAATILYNQHPLVTTPSEIETIETEIEEIPFETTYIDEPTWEFDQQETTQAGQNGSMTRTYNVHYYFGEEVDREYVGEEQTEPITQIITRGTKPKTIQTPEGVFSYTGNYSMWSTSYDGNCPGCSGITYTGTTVHHGICAVDPYIIALGTRMYIPGYGMCTAADIGGAIKGYSIDLGFENVANGWWSARWTDVYVE